MSVKPSTNEICAKILKDGIERRKAQREAHSLQRPCCAAAWSVKPIFAWYDCWVGIFWDSRKRKLYILPLPCVGVVIELPKRHNKP